MAVTHAGLTIQQVADIQKSLLVALRKRDTFWDKFCSHTSIPNNYDAIEWRKLDITELGEGDISNLTEGITPAGLSLSYKKFRVTPVNFGSWIGYTDESKKYNFDDVVRDAKTVLGQRAFEEVEIRKGHEFVVGTSTMDLTSDDGTNNGFLKDLLKARTFLKKNHAKPINGSKFGCILTPEQAAEVLVNYQKSITHTSEREAVISGYIGELGGFILFENADAVMYKPATEAVACVAEITTDVEIDTTKTYYTRASSAAGAGKLNDGTYAYTKVASPVKGSLSDYYEVSVIGTDAANEKGYCLFIGKTDYGMPVQTVSFGNASLEMYNNELGKAVSVDANNNVVADTLHQHGSVGYKVMGFAARILAEEAIIRAEFDLGVSGQSKLDVVDNTVADTETALGRRDYKVAPVE